MQRRRTIAIISAVTLAAGLLGLLVPPAGSSWDAAAGSCIRIGAVMFAIWLAYPDLERIPTWLWGGLLTAVAIVAARPKSAFIVVPALALIAWLGRDRRGWNFFSSRSGRGRGGES